MPKFHTSLFDATTHRARFALGAAGRGTALSGRLANCAWERALALGRACACLLLALGLGVPLASLAQDAITERAYLEDPSGSLQWADVQQPQHASAFKTYAGPLNRGYSAQAVWVRLRLPGSAPGASDPAQITSGFAPWYVLRIQPGYIDEIALYDPLGAGAQAPKVGDRHPVPHGSYRSLNHNFVVPMGDAPRTVWLRLQTTSTNLIHVEALGMAQASTQDTLQNLFLGVFLGFLLLFFLWSFMHWRLHREPLMGILAIHQLSSLLFSLAILGYLRLFVGDYVPAIWLDQLTSVLVVGTTAAAVAFNRSFVDEFGPGRRTRLVITAVFYIGPVLLVLIALGFVRLAMHANMVLISVTPLLFLFAAITGRDWKRKADSSPTLMSRPFVVGYYVVGMALLVSFSLPSLGVAPSAEITLQANSIYGFVTGVLLLALLQRRANRLEELHQQGQTKLTITHQQMAQEAQQRKDQAQFMAMLTHELKTPLSVLRMALGLTTSSPAMRARSDQAIQDMSNVIDRFAWVDKLEEKAFTVHLSGFDALKELDHLLFTHNSEGRITRQADESVPWPVRSDVRLFCTVLNNLVHNALRYSPSDSQVHVTLQQTKLEGVSTLRIEIANTPGASGWPDPERVFQKYYRSPGAQRQTGTGLGLYQAARITVQLGGTLSYEPDSTLVRFVWCIRC
jgi:signal transduction histidine kinase